jgi:hypothetical protein
LLIGKDSNVYMSSARSVKASVVTSVVATQRLAAQTFRQKVAASVCEMTSIIDDQTFTCGGVWVDSRHILTSSALIVDSKGHPIAERFVVKTLPGRFFAASCRVVCMRAGLVLLSTEDAVPGTVPIRFGSASHLAAAPCSPLGDVIPAVSVYSLANASIGENPLAEGMHILTLADPVGAEEPGVVLGHVRSCIVPLENAPVSFGVNLPSRPALGAGVFSVLTGEFLGVTVYAADCWYGVTHPVTTKSFVQQMLLSPPTRISVAWPPQSVPGNYLSSSKAAEMQLVLPPAGRDLVGFVVSGQSPPFGLNEGDFVQFVRNDTSRTLVRIGSVWPAVPLDFAWSLFTVGDRFSFVVTTSGEGLADGDRLALAVPSPLQPITAQEDAAAGLIVYAFEAQE